MKNLWTMILPLAVVLMIGSAFAQGMHHGGLHNLWPDSLTTIEVTGTEEKVEGMIDMLRDFRIREVVRSGKIAISRGKKASARSKK